MEPDRTSTKFSKQISKSIKVKHFKVMVKHFKVYLFIILILIVITFIRMISTLYLHLQYSGKTNFSSLITKLADKLNSNSLGIHYWFH